MSKAFYTTHETQEKKLFALMKDRTNCKEITLAISVKFLTFVYNCDIAFARRASSKLYLYSFVNSLNSARHNLQFGRELNLLKLPNGINYTE